MKINKKNNSSLNNTNSKISTKLSRNFIFEKFNSSLRICQGVNNILTSDAFHFRIACEARRAAALLNVTPHVAFRIYSTRGSHVARIEALSVQAHVRQVAFLVRLAGRWKNFKISNDRTTGDCLTIGRVCYNTILTSTDALVTIGIGRAVRGRRTNNRFWPTPYA